MFNTLPIKMIFKNIDNLIITINDNDLQEVHCQDEFFNGKLFDFFIEKIEKYYCIENSNLTDKKFKQIEKIINSITNIIFNFENSQHENNLHFHIELVKYLNYKKNNKYLINDCGIVYKYLLLQKYYFDDKLYSIYFDNIKKGSEK